MNENIKIIVCSLPDHEDLVAEIYIDGRFVGLVAQEKQRGYFEFEIEKSSDDRIFDLKTVVAALQLASSRLSSVG